MDLDSREFALLSLPSGLDVSVVGGLPSGVLTSAEQRQQTSRHRKYNFSFREKDLLVGLIEEYGDVVESRVVTIEHKVRAWCDIQRRFNEQNGGAQPRSVSELKKCYWNLKQKTKKALEAERDSVTPVRVDRVLWRIAQLAPEQFEGLLDMHCEVVDVVPETDVTAKEGNPDTGESEVSRLEYPLQSLESGRNTPPSDQVLPNPSDFLSVEISDSGSKKSTESRSEEWLRSLASVIPPLHPLTGSLSSVLKDRLGDHPTSADSLTNGASKVRSGKRVACDSEGSENPQELRKTEHEFRMRLLRQEAEFMEAKHRLEMEVLEHQRVFWREALKRARCNENGQC